MKYSYEIDDQNVAKVTYGTEPFFNFVVKKGSLTDNLPWTQEDAKSWAEETIQLIKDNNGVYSEQTPVVTTTTIVIKEEDL
jgi:hypothetical protein